MTCERLTADNGALVWICSRGRRPRQARCEVRGCRRAAPYACDHPTGEGQSCDLRLCPEHARARGDDRHLCPEHATITGQGESAMKPTLPGEITNAKFAGRCVLCGGAVQVGDRIHYNKRTEHLTCAEEALEALAPLAGAPPVVFCREEPPQLGRALRLAGCDGKNAGRVVVPLVHRRRYYKEDGLSFGLSKDNGWLYTAEARPATAEEVDQLEAAEAAALAMHERRRRWDEVRARVKATIQAGGKPEKPEPTGREWPAKRSRFDADYLVIDEGRGLVWLVIYNGRDGDCWAWSNWGSSIVWEAPLSAELRADLVQLGALAGG